MEPGWNCAGAPTLLWACPHGVASAIAFGGTGRWDPGGRCLVVEGVCGWILGVATEGIKQGEEGDGGCSVGRRSVRANTPQATPARYHGKAQPQLCGARPCDLLTGIPAPGSSGNPTREPRSWQWVRKRGWHPESPGSCPMA